MSTRKDKQDPDAPDLEPAQQETIPGPTYENPNEDQAYVPPTERAAAADEWATPTDGPEPGADQA